MSLALRRSAHVGERTWACGHPRTPENTQPCGVAGSRCRLCRREVSRLNAERSRYPAVTIGQDVRGRWAWMLFGPGHQLLASDWDYDSAIAAEGEAQRHADLLREMHRETGAWRR
jgi:hypothetical protein